MRNVSIVMAVTNDLGLFTNALWENAHRPGQVLAGAHRFILRGNVQPASRQ